MRLVKVSALTFASLTCREVQQFHPDVRNSPEVDFAVQAFAALNSNNFVRFFKLVQSASYLNACLLHCYFNQVRRAPASWGGKRGSSCCGDEVLLWPALFPDGGQLSPHGPSQPSRGVLFHSWMMGQHGCPPGEAMQGRCACGAQK